LSLAPVKDVVSKKLVANLVACPTLGAPSRETQANPLLDNNEGMTIIGGPGLAAVSMISDDNFSATQFTRSSTLIMVRSRLGCRPRRALEKSFRRTSHSSTGPYCMNAPAMS
jgi:hypothetical protein